MKTFIEHPIFTKQIETLLTADEYRRLQMYLAEHPSAGDVIPGLSGLRKVRWAVPGRGKRGGLRVIYLLLLASDIICLFYAYTKGKMTDLTPEQHRRLKDAVTRIKKEYRV